MREVMAFGDNDNDAENATFSRIGRRDGECRARAKMYMRIASLAHIIRQRLLIFNNLIPLSSSNKTPPVSFR